MQEAVSQKAVLTVISGLTKLLQSHPNNWFPIPILSLFAKSFSEFVLDSVSFEKGPRDISGLCWLHIAVSVFGNDQ